jgi:formylglycine-generating enzyme required for sulfatase activity
MKYSLLIPLVLLLVGCSPSESVIQPAIAQTQAGINIPLVTEVPTVPPPTQANTNIANVTEAPTAPPVPTQTPGDPEDHADTKGVIMRLVPGGEFSMGLSADTAYAECQKLNNGGTCNRDWFTDEEPAYTVTLDSFYMDKFEVSNTAYRQCVVGGGCQPPYYISSDSRTQYYGDAQYDNYPVINVDWDQAVTYCAWRGARLPSEAEWEKAARGSDGRLYPWGNMFDGTQANSCDTNCSADEWRNPSFNDGYADTAPVDAFPSGVSEYGIYNLAGNVFEWTSSLYQFYPYSASDGREDLTSNGDRVLRGGSWISSGFSLLSAYRVGFNPMVTVNNVGFRCVLDSSQ